MVEIAKGQINRFNGAKSLKSLYDTKREISWLMAICNLSFAVKMTTKEKILESFSRPILFDV